MKSKIPIIIVLIALTGLFWQSFSQAAKQKPTALKPLAKKVEPGLRVLEIGPDRILLEWFAPPTETVTDPVTGQVTEVRMAGTNLAHEPGVILLPTLSEVFDALPGQVSVTLLNPEYAPLLLGDCLPMPEDWIIDDRPSAPSEEAAGITRVQSEGLSLLDRQLRQPKSAQLTPDRNVEVSEAGVYRGHQLRSVTLKPVQVNTLTGMGRILKSAKIQILLPNSSNDEMRMADRATETRALRNMLGILAESALPTRIPDRRETREHDNLDDHEGPIYNVNSWRVYVRETSIVRLTGEYMHLMGVPLDRVTPWDLHVYNKGREIPIVVEGQEDGSFDDFDYVEFFGERNERTYLDKVPSLYQDPFSAENCYLLYWGDGRPGMRMGEINGSWQPTWNLSLERSVRVTMHFERDRYYDRLSQSPIYLSSRLTREGPLALIQDNWFWGDRIDALTSRNFDEFVPFPNPNAPYSFFPVIVRACMTGYSPGGLILNHYATVSLNGLTDNGLTAGKQSLSDPDTSWVAEEPIIFETVLDSGVSHIQTEDLLNGINTFSVTVPGNELSGTLDKVLVNWFELEYERDMRSRNGEFRFHFDKTLGDTFAYDIRGFGTPNVQVWKLGQARLTSLDTRRVTPADESASWSVRFPIISDGPQDVLVFGENYIFPPFRMEPDTIQIDLRNNTGAEYVMIAYDPFLADTSLRILDSLRRISFDNSVLTIPLSEIYEQFSGGLVTPYAVHDFLQYAYDNWDVRPTHCCLIGDAVLEQREGNVPGNQIPSFPAVTLSFGAASADYLMGCVSGPGSDIIPDIAVGRISCRTPLELQTYVGKIIKYETEPDYQGMFQSNVLMIADTFDGSNNFSRNYSEPAIRMFTEGDRCYNVTRLYLDSIPAGQGPIRLRDELRNGCVVANYNGHGGGGVWSGARLIQVDGVRLLNNRLSFPFITNFTCYVGAFDDRSQSAVLGEAFMFTRNNNNDLIGGIGFYSSSGVGWAISGQIMQRNLFDFFLEPPGYTIGEAVQFNKARYWSALNTPVTFTPTMGMMMMMNLLGDPGLRLSLPKETIEPEIFAESNVLDPTDGENSDSLRVIINPPWEPSQALRAYVAPYNGDVIEAIQFDTTRVRFSLRSTHTPAFDPRDFDPLDCESRPCTTEAVGLPRFVATRGKTVVYITDPIARRSAIGCLPIFLADSLEHVQILDVLPVPGPVAVSGEEFRVSATILHQDDVERVRYRGVYTPAQGPITIDTVNMVQTEPGYFQTPLPLGPYDFDTEGATYRIKFFVTPTGQDEIESSFYDLPLEQQPDFNLTFVQSSSPGEQGGRRPYYYQPIRVSRSSATADIGDVKVRLITVRDCTYFASGDTVRVLLDSFAVDHIVSTLGFGEAEQGAWMPTSLSPAAYDLTIIVDPDNEYRESNENNNRRDVTIALPKYYPVAQTIGTFYARPLQVGAHRYWSMTQRDTLYVRVPPGSLPRDSASIGYTQPRALAQADLFGLQALGLRTPFSQSTHGVFKAMFDDTLATLSDSMPLFVTLKLEGRDTLRASVPVNNYAVFARDPRRDYWVRATNLQTTRLPVDTFRVTNPGNPSLDSIVVWQLSITGSVPHLGELALFRQTDVQGPNIELAVGGLRFTQGALVPDRPQIFATFRDPAGVQRSGETFHLILDGDTLADDLIAWNDTSLVSAAALTAMIEPDLADGQHTLEVRATDNYGNVSSYVAQFEVRGTFGFEWAINYPNPFRNNTTIAYVLTGVTDDFTQIKIYTVSGRLIRTLRDTERATANYRTMTWDGRDDEGEEVANGVYFARIIAKHHDQTIEETVKLAKVRL
ncbi:MAG: T9SS type A sorting domain-containing protein [bacterium]|nr:T9SS type A sorting domain-containing protein [bacterium]